MKLTDRLSRWRIDLAESADPAEPEPTEEKVLQQFLYSAISDLLEDDDWCPRVADAPEYEDVLDKWVNHYSADSE